MDDERYRLIVEASVDYAIFHLGLTATGVAPQRYTPIRITMPKLAGAEAALELRRLQPDIPIVAMSGYGDVEVMERFSGSRIDDYLAKPFRSDRLASKVREVLALAAG